MLQLNRNKKIATKKRNKRRIKNKNCRVEGDFPRLCSLWQRWHHFLGFFCKSQDMKTNFYRAICLFVIAAAFAACRGHNSAGNNSTADSVVVTPPDNTNTNTFDPPPGDTTAMLKDSLYNASQAKKRHDDSMHRKNLPPEK